MNVAACHNAFVLTLAAVTITFMAVKSHGGGAGETGAVASLPMAAFSSADGGDTSVPSALAVLAGHSASDESVSAPF